MMSRLFVEIRESKTGKRYCCLCYDFGYRIAVLSFDSSICSELSCISIRDLMSSPSGSTFTVVE